MLLVTPTIAASDTNYCSEWHQLLQPVTPTIAASDTNYCSQWHQILLRVTPTIAASDIKYCCEWHQLLLRMTSATAVSNVEGKDSSRVPSLCTTTKASRRWWRHKGAVLSRQPDWQQSIWPANDCTHRHSLTHHVTSMSVYNIRFFKAPQNMIASDYKSTTPLGPSVSIYNLQLNSLGKTAFSAGINQYNGKPFSVFWSLRSHMDVSWVMPAGCRKNRSLFKL